MMGGTNDLCESLVQGLKQARERKKHLLKELEVTERLIEAQQKALKMYAAGSQQLESDAPRGDKTLLIADALKAAKNGLSIAETYEQVRQPGIERDYVRKVLGRLVTQEKARKESGRYYWVAEK